MIMRRLGNSCPGRNLPNEVPSSKFRYSAGPVNYVEISESEIRVHFIPLIVARVFVQNAR